MNLKRYLVHTLFALVLAAAWAGAGRAETWTPPAKALSCADYCWMWGTAHYGAFYGWFYGDSDVADSAASRHYRAVMAARERSGCDACEANHAAPVHVELREGQLELRYVESMRWRAGFVWALAVAAVLGFWFWLRSQLRPKQLTLDLEG